VTILSLAAGKEPVDTFLAQISGDPNVGRVGHKSGRYRLRLVGQADGQPANNSRESACTNAFRDSGAAFSPRSAPKVAHLLASPELVRSRDYGRFARGLSRTLLVSPARMARIGAA
jgi:hypothetical protein